MITKTKNNKKELQQQLIALIENFIKPYPKTDAEKVSKVIDKSSKKIVKALLKTPKENHIKQDIIKKNAISPKLNVKKKNTISK